MDDQKRELDTEELDIWNERTRELRVSTPDGKTEAVFIKKCGLGQMPALYGAQANDTKTALIYLSHKDPENKAHQQWFEDLDPESQLLILEKGDELNSDFLERWWTRRKKKLKALGVDVEAEMEMSMEAARKEIAASAAGGLKSEESPSPSEGSSATSSREVAAPVT